jgi:hypothetical protein
VINEFYARVGSGYAPYLENRASVAPVDCVGEQAIAARAGDLVVGLCGAPPALAFERALLAEDQGRFHDARSDLKQVLAAYPGFVAAAVAAARLALASGDPAEALRALAPVEGEIAHIRDGAALLADAVRAIGLPEAASRYDLAALICRGGYDSRGNDCAPVDLTGKIANDERMPQSLYLEGQVDGSVICNAGGIYYNVNPFIGHLLTVVNRGHRFSTLRSFGPSVPKRQKRAIAEFFEAATARLQLLLGSRFPNASVLLQKCSASAWSGLRRVLAAVFRFAASIDFALVVSLHRAAGKLRHGRLYDLYRRLPVPVRRWANKTVQFVAGSISSAAKLPMAFIKPLVRDTIGPRLLSPILDSCAREQLAEARYRSGLARIFGLPPLANGTEGTSHTGAFLEERLSILAKPTPNEDVGQPEGQTCRRAESAHGGDLGKA